MKTELLGGIRLIGRVIPKGIAAIAFAFRLITAHTITAMKGNDGTGADDGERVHAKGVNKRGYILLFHGAVSLYEDLLCLPVGKRNDIDTALQLAKAHSLQITDGHNLLPIASNGADCRSIVEQADIVAADQF